MDTQINTSNLKTEASTSNNKINELSTPMARGNRLYILRCMSGLTIQEIAEKYDIGASTIKYWESAKSEGLSEKGAKKFIESMALEGIYCSYMWLMHGLGINPQYIDKRYGTNKKQQRLMHTSLAEEMAIYREIDVFLNETENAITLAIYDDAMEPFYFLGDTVGGNRLFGNDILRAFGKDCIIETEDHQVLCRHLIAGHTAGDCYTLCCINPKTTAYPMNICDTKIVSVAPITRIWKRLGNSSNE